MRDDVGVADDAGRAHAERSEDLAGQELAVEHPRHARHDDAAEDVAHVVVLPATARHEVEGVRMRDADELVVAVFAAQVEHPAVIL